VPIEKVVVPTHVRMQGITQVGVFLYCQHHVSLPGSHIEFT